MKKVSVFLLALFLVGAGTAFAQDVRYNYDMQTNFATFKTYKWVPIKGAKPVNDLLNMQIKEAFNAELAKKGLTMVDTDTADLYVGYQAGLDKQAQYNSFDTGWGYGPGWGGGWYGGGGGITTTTTSTIYVGQLALDMYAPGSKQIVWRGMATKTIDDKAKPEKQQKNLDKAVAKMLKNYPPPEKK